MVYAEISEKMTLGRIMVSTTMKASSSCDNWACNQGACVAMLTLYGTDS